MIRGYTLDQALSGLRAYDQGCIDSGIHDETLRAEVTKALNTMSPNERRRAIAGVAIFYLSAAGLDAGYGLEDVVSFAEWLEDYMGVSM